MDKYARFRYQPCIPLGEDGRCATASVKHTQLSRKAATEGMVLLKNKDNALPLKKGEKVALFGKATIEYIKGGGGSGDVHCPYIRNVFDGFKEKEKDGKTAVYMPLVDFYKDYVEKESVNVLTPEQIDARWSVVNAMEFCTERDDMTYDTFAAMHVKETFVPDELIKSASEWADTAVFTISRFSAEGVDRRPQGGDYYLSDIEKNLVDKLCELFKKVVIVINSGATIDCEYFAENDKVSAVLFGWQGGMEGGMAIADVLCGDVNPSGKLCDTIVKSYDSYPCKDEFWESFKFIDYSDDIYVGYRYFETMAKDDVRYPFGFGLSYTTFEISGKVCCESEGKIVAVANVKNTGNVAGREILQIYYSAPQGKLGKPAKELAAFAEDWSTEHGKNSYERRLGRAVISTLYSLGLRRAELIGLVIGDMDFGRKVVKVRGKGNKMREIPFPDSLSEEILLYLKAVEVMCGGQRSLKEPVFVTYKGRSLYPAYVDRLVKSELADVKGLTGRKSPHVLRHSLATELMNGNADLNSVKELLGHSSLAATQVYTHSSVARLKDIYKQAHPRAKNGGKYGD